MSLALPIQWVWDIIDEFIYQFQSFTQYRSKVVRQGKDKDEIDEISQRPSTWNVHIVLNVLHKLIEKSNINEQV